jgi:ABC-type transport system involved in multi-copper enzyme maturation permease subunit
MMAIPTIALLVLREASRRKLLLALVLLTVVLALFTGWGFHKILTVRCGTAGQQRPCSATEMRAGFAALLILLVFMFSWVLGLAAALVAAPAISSDIESGIVLAILPRPIRRSDMILGKWLGLSLLVLIYGGLAMTMEFVIVHIAAGYTPPHPVLATLFVVAEGIAVVTLTMLTSTRLPAMTCGIISVILFGLVWMGGVAGTIGTAFSNQAIENVGTVSTLIFPTDGLWRGALYNLEPAAFIALNTGTDRAASANPFAVASPPPTPYLVWVLAWGVVVLGVAIFSFNRREL